MPLPDVAQLRRIAADYDDLLDLAVSLVRVIDNEHPCRQTARLYVADDGICRLTWLDGRGREVSSREFSHVCLDKERVEEERRRYKKWRQEAQRRARETREAEERVLLAELKAKYEK